MVTAAAVTSLCTVAVDHEQFVLLPQAGELLVQHAGCGELRAVEGQVCRWPNHNDSSPRPGGQRRLGARGGRSCSPAPSEIAGER